MHGLFVDYDPFIIEKKLLLTFALLSPSLFPHTAFEIQVLTISTVKCQGDFRIFQFALANCQTVSRNLCITGPQWLWNTSTIFQGL